MELLPQRPSLFSHPRRWGSRARPPERLMTGPWLVTDPDDVALMLGSGSRHYVEQSAFLRTRNYDPLPAKPRGEAIQGLLSAVDSHPPDVWGSGLQIEPGRWNRTQAWGIRLMRNLYAEAIAYQRPGELDQLVDRFVERKTIKDDVWGAFDRLPPGERDVLHGRVGSVLASLRQVDDRRDDLAGVVAHLDLDLEPIERGELFLRLVQSMVAFTGVAVEFATWYAASRKEIASDFAQGRCQGHIYEILRLFPTTWRLVRKAAEPHDLGGASIDTDDDLIIATTSIHRDPARWEDAHEYLPSRWEDPSTKRSKPYIPFGKGRGMCPGRNLALEVMDQVLHRLHAQYQVEVRRTWKRVPYVRSILAPPLAYLRFTEKPEAGPIAVKSGGCPFHAAHPETT